MATRIAADRYSHLLDRLEDAEDSLDAILAKTEETPIPAEQVYEELDIRQIAV